MVETRGDYETMRTYIKVMCNMGHYVCIYVHVYVGMYAHLSVLYAQSFTCMCRHHLSVFILT